MTRGAWLGIGALVIVAAAAIAVCAWAWDWLSLSIDPTRPDMIDALSSWHARAMVLGWAVLFPIGIFAARFFKIMPGQDWPRVLDNVAWWRTHRAMQRVGATLVGIGLVLILVRGTSFGDLSLLHRVVGWTVVVLLAVQLIGGWLRGSKGGPTAPAPDGSLHGDHYDMTPRRKLFERVHKFTGWLALILATVEIELGLWLVSAPRWMVIGLTLWFVLLVATFTILQLRGLNRDTYEAIWGPDRRHPGNTMRPIGWGVRRAADQ